MTCRVTVPDIRLDRLLLCIIAFLCLILLVVVTCIFSNFTFNRAVGGKRNVFVKMLKKIMLSVKY